MLGPWICFRAALLDFCTGAADHSRVAHDDVRPSNPSHGGKLDWTRALVIGFLHPHLQPNSNELDSG